MNGLEITKELRNAIEENQNHLQNAIRNHQKWILKLKADPFEDDLVLEVKHAEEQIVLVGLKQKTLLARLREEYQAHQKSLKQTVLKSALEERRFNLSNVLNRARKQNLPVVRPPSVQSYSDESEGRGSVNSSPEHGPKPVNPHDVTQTKFLNYFCLVSHDVYKEMQNKRAERKRRSTANPHFLYGNKGWDFMGPLPKRRRRQFLSRPISPPNTRQSTRKRQERASPTNNENDKANINGNHDSSPVGNGVFGSFHPMRSGFPNIPNLPSGLIIQRINSGSGSPDSQLCITCKQSGSLLLCEACSNGFHIGCHNRPLAKAPRHCPKCIDRENQRSRGLNIIHLPTQEFAEKLNQKKELEEKRQNLNAELTQLQHRHSQLTVFLRKQQSEQEKMLLNQQSTENKVNQILQFIEKIKNSSLNSQSSDSNACPIENAVKEECLKSDTHKESQNSDSKSSDLSES